jgi:hypothetical protein
MQSEIQTQIKRQSVNLQITHKQNYKLIFSAITNLSEFQQ